MNRFVPVIVCLLASSPLGIALGADADSPPTSQAATLTAELALAQLARGDGFSSDSERDQAQALIDAAAAREPNAAKWKFAQGMLLRQKGERIAARDAVEAAVKLEPKNADYQSWYGTTIFESINEVGFLSKMSWAGAGRDAYLEALRLNPNHVVTLFALVQYYVNAPGIAGGSYAKATEHANALLAVPDGRGAFFGHMALASIAGSKEEWAEMSRQYTLAETAGGEGANPSQAMTAHAFMLLDKVKDPEAALVVIERAEQANTDPKNVTPLYFKGLARQALKQFDTAVEAYAAVLAVNPDARNTRYNIAVCYETLGKLDLAITHYDEFFRRFPDDDRASEAKASAKRLRKKLGK
jgi:tetratricopeptide (TPR) repeat protein